MKKSVQLSNYLSQVCLGLTFLMLFGLTSQQLQAQQNPYPFNVDLSLGGGLIGNPDANTTFQPELGFSYMPGKFGVGLNAGLLSYDPSFDAQQYAAGFEDYTSVSGSDEKWSSFFFGIGPRFEFGSQLPVTFRSSLDLSLSYNSPPSVSVDFNDPDGSAAGVDLQLSGYEAGEDYSKWSAALRPEFQMQFSPGGSDRFAIQVTTGIQHRLSKNEFTYSQRDLSDVQVVPNSQEMFMQFEMAPEVQRSAQPPKTNFFTTVGIKIKFGGSTAPAAPGQDYNSSRSNKPGGSIANDGVGDGDEDSDDDGVPDAVETAQDYNSSRSNKPTSEAAPDDIIEIKREGLATAENYINDIIKVLDRCEGEVCAQVRKNADGRLDNTRKARQGQISQDQGIEDIHSIVMEDVVSLSKCGTGVCREVLAMEQNLLAHMNDLMGVVQATRAQDYNAARSNKPTSRAEDIGDGDMDSDDDGIGDAVETAQETRGIDKKDIRRGEVNSDDCDDVGPCPRPDDTMFKAKELGLASVGNDISNIKQVLDRCEEGVCGQVRQHADHRDSAVRSALENPTEVDTHIEEILNIVKEDVESLGKCETDVCREALVMEEKLLVKMNRLSDLAQIAPAQDYNAARSNKPTSRANDIGDGDLDSDDDGIDDAVETAKDYNSSRSNKPRSEDGRGGNDDIVREANRMARLINPPNAIISVGSVVMAANPLYEGNTTEGESPLYEGQANDGGGNGGTFTNEQRYSLEPVSNSMKSEAKDYNSSRSNKPSSIADIGDLDGDGFPDVMKSASFSISKRSARTGRNPSGDEDMDSDGDGIHFDLEIDPIDPDDDGDGISDAIESATYSISKRSARTGRSVSTDNNESESMEWDGNAEKRKASASDDDPCGPGVWARTTGGNANCTPENSDQENPVSEATPPNNVHQWSYNLNSLADGQDMPGGTLTVLFTGGEWHFDVQVDHVDPDDDGDGFGDLLQNSSFSISKRSARTGRN